MRVETLGSGDPEVAVVAAIHGDEPCGVRAIERVLEEDPAVKEPAKLVVANELALERGVRYVDEDMNRAFPGAPEAETHEARLAYRLGEELEGCRVLAMHSTQSHGEPFAVVDGVHDFAREVVPHLPVAALVDSANFVEGRIFASAPECVEVECGLQGSEQAAENAYSLTRAFLTALDVLPGDTQPREVPVYRLFERVAKAPGSRHEVHVENFTRVAPGTRFASVDGEDRVAETEFYPVLMSANGYEDVFGYSAERIGSVG
ncbi:succinylglutamate desuccinylase [Halorubellus sp. JP-L1]|uniref:succinylglutamate desuccinylase/aspartoacylase domain-containing protein n=1 Tax=Halorubellus sp. JP-L1 TaxID=2715753 RepID=UPI001407F77E|nr:succinylglutamate desuccinylase/aspartoacylase family protein [Halorubellus sp. JP-L1]NHN40985.1 succinylglutamate desuccinylase [Halorubellus sp. JP-L1]